MPEDPPYLEQDHIQIVASILEHIDLNVWGLMIDAEAPNEIWVQFDTELQVPILPLSELKGDLEAIDVDRAERIIWELEDHNIDEVEGTFHITVEAIVITAEPEKVAIDG